MLFGMRWLLVPSLLVTISLVIANAISISVRERRVEMAVLKVLGFSPNQILLLVLSEALLIGCMSGVRQRRGDLVLGEPTARRHRASDRIFQQVFRRRRGALVGTGDRRRHGVDRQHRAGMVGKVGESVGSVFQSGVDVDRCSVTICMRLTSAESLTYVCMLLLILFAVAGGAIGLAIAVVVVLVLLVSVFLFGLMFLQAVGLAPRVPLGYSFRNLMVRWRTTLLTTLAFTLVVALMTVMLAFVNGMYSLTKGSSVRGQYDRVVRRRARRSVQRPGLWRHRSCWPIAITCAR